MIDTKGLNTDTENQLIKAAMSLLGKRSAIKNGANRDYKGMQLKGAETKRRKKLAKQAPDQSLT